MAARTTPIADQATDRGDGTRAAAGRAYVLHPALRAGRDEKRSPEARLAEAAGLAAAIDLTVVHAEVVRVDAPRPATLFGTGTVERLGKLLEEEEPAEVVIVDAAVTPVQQRNLEKAWKCKVIDRTGLILEIFGARARTHEGSLQVELAALTYQRSRLVRSWTHLERQRGGFGFLGGPGESQLEIDRRLIGERIAKLKLGLENTKRTRGLHREARRRVPYPVIALVGYTNAGKSTLFNRLTRATVMAEDMLFATLDPTMRVLELPSGRKVILSDTVGFISDLPTTLVAAIRATLEEVTAADLIIHVRDVSHPDTVAQKADVERVLGELGLADELSARMIEGLNKIDLLMEEERAVVARQAERQEGQVAFSAVTGQGLEQLLALVEARLGASRTLHDLELDVRDGSAIAWLYNNGEVIERTDEGEVARLRVRLDPVDVARFRQHHHPLRMAAVR